MRGNLHEETESLVPGTQQDEKQQNTACYRLLSVVAKLHSAADYRAEPTSGYLVSVWYQVRSRHEDARMRMIGEELEFKGDLAYIAFYEKIED